MLGLQAIYADVKIKDQVVRVYFVHLASINIVGGINPDTFQEMEHLKTVLS